MSIISQNSKKVKFLRGKKFRKTKLGAASFYIVMFATLLLTVIAISFATIILSQIARTSNDDLSNSAYDAALAGVEDAKTAILDYEACLNGTATTGSSGISCGNLISIMTGAGDTSYTGTAQDCDKVGRILQRYSNNNKGGEVMIQENRTTTGTTNSSGENSMAEAYTCVKVSDTSEEYKATLSESNTSRLIAAKLSRPVQSVDSIVISWHSGSDISINNSGSRSYLYGNERLKFWNNSTVVTPPVISFGIVQTGATTSDSNLDTATVGNITNFAMAYLVPTNISSAPSVGVQKARRYVYANGNQISKSQFAATNNLTSENLPFATYCQAGLYDGYACKVRIYLPDAASGARRDLLIKVSSPYHQSTDFSLQFLDSSGNIISAKGMQYDVDSTGRASNLYRRVETRLETSDAYYPFPDAELQATGTGENDGITKTIYSLIETHFTSF